MGRKYGGTKQKNYSVKQLENYIARPGSIHILITLIHKWSQLRYKWFIFDDFTSTCNIISGGCSRRNIKEVCYIGPVVIDLNAIIAIPKV